MSATTTSPLFLGCRLLYPIEPASGPHVADFGIGGILDRRRVDSGVCSRGQVAAGTRLVLALVDGVINYRRGLMNWWSWPASSAWAIGVLVGVSMLFSGISRLMLSLAARQLMGRNRPATAG